MCKIGNHLKLFLRKKYVLTIYNYILLLTHNKKGIIMDMLIDNLIISITQYNKEVDNTYTDMDLLQEKLETLIKECQTGYVNRCLECNVDMGECNPRQLCGKTYCYSQ